jgi:hypothetical protein
MKFIFKFFLLGIFLPALSFAQSNFKPGYVVTLKGDTLRGEVDLKTWNYNPKEFRFKTGNNTVQVFSISNTKAFGVDNTAWYERFTLRISTDAVDLPRLHYSLDTAGITDVVFLKVLARGKNISLYSYTDAIKGRFYVNDKTEQPHELIYHIYKEGTENSIATQKLYRNELARYAFNYNVQNANLNMLLERATYTPDDLTNIVNVINNDEHHKSTRKSTYSFRLVAGAAVAQASLKYDGPVTIAEGALNKTEHFAQFGIGVDMFEKANTGRLIFRAEAQYWSATMVAATPTVQQILKMNTITLSPQILLNIYKAPALKVFVGAGVRFNISTYPQNDFSTNYNVFTVLQQDFPKMQKNWTSADLKAGVIIYQNVELYASYNTTVAINVDQRYNGYFRMLQAGFHYLL